MLRVDRAGDGDRAARRRCCARSRVTTPRASTRSSIRRRRACVVSGVAPALAAELRAFGLVDGDDDALEGQHRIRRIGERFYVLELGGTLEYVQDVWPETDALLDGDRARAGRAALADVGTGSGVLAIEAAARGHRVVATDLYDTALAAGALQRRA